MPLALGSDSHVTRAWAEELRWLEYGQRLLHRAAQRRRPRRPLDEPRHRGAAVRARARRRRRGRGLRAPGAWCAGARADLLVLDTQDTGLLGVPASHALDALVFATDAPALRDVWVAGRRVVAGGRHIGAAAATGRSAAEVAADLAAGFAGTMAELWPA